MASCLHESCPFLVTPKPSLRAHAHAQKQSFVFNFFLETPKALGVQYDAFRCVRSVETVKVQTLRKKAGVLEEFSEERKVATEE